MESEREERTAQLVLLAVVLGILSLFVTRAFSIDDPLFLWLGRHLLEHPLDFYGFEVNWYGTSMPMHEVTMNPPLAGYFIAVIGGLFGFSEVAMHLAFLIPAGAVCLGTYRLARGMCSRPLLASLLGLLTPVFLLSSTSVMCDTLMLAFWVWAVHLWRAGLRGERTGLLVAAAVLASCAALTKYYGLALVPLLGAYGLLFKRRPGMWVLPLLIPVAVAAGYELLTSAMYGHGLIGSARTYAAGLRGREAGGSLESAVSGLVFLGGCAATAFFAGPLLLGRRWALGILGLLVVVAIAAGRPHLLLGVDADELATSALAMDVQILLMAFGGAVVVVIAALDLWRRRDPDSALLACWALGTFVFAAFMNWVNNGRTNLPLVPAIGILLARRLEFRASSVEPRSQRYLVASLAPAALLSILVVHSDYLWSGAVRQAAEELTRRHIGPRELYFQGHWGFQYYAELGGARPLDLARDRLRKGDAVMQPTNNVGVERLPPTHVELVQSYEYPAPTWVHTMGYGSGACFYADNWAPLPFAIGGSRPDVYTVWEVKKNFGWRIEQNP